MPSRLFTSPRKWVWALWLVAVGFTAAYLRVAIPRLLYPYDLDFVEDGLLMQAWRVAEHQPVFVSPNVEFVPHVYMPLFTWLGGWLFRWTGPSFLPLRLLSFTATLITAVLIFWIARRESGNRVIAASSAALFLAGYRLAGGFYELARVDALFVMLVMAGVTVVVYGRSTPTLILAGCLFGLSFLTKQHGFLFAALAAIHLAVTRPRALWHFVIPFGLVAFLPIAWLHWTTDGWFSTYVFNIAYANPITLGRLAYVLRVEFLPTMSLLLLFYGGSLAVQLSDWRGRWLVERPIYPFVGLALLISIAGRASVGGALNNIILGYTFLCLAPTLLITQLPNYSKQVRQWIARLLPMAILLQFALTLVNPMPIPEQFLPTAEMQAGGDRLIARLAQVDGPVLVMMHPYYALSAGKRPSAQIQALWHGRRRGQDPLPPDFVSRIQTQHYALIISDEGLFFETEPALLALIETHYERHPLPENESPSTLSGLVTRPQAMYVPRP